MRSSFIFYAVVVAIPVLVIAYFFINVATVVLVHNTGAQDTDVSMVIASGNEFERTPDKALKAKNYALILFYPQTSGDLSVTCLKDGHWKGFAVGHGSSSGFSAFDLTLDSCNRLLSKKSVTL